MREAIDVGGVHRDESYDLTMVAKTTVALGEADAAKRVLRLIDALDDHDDVQEVYANFDIPEAILEEASA